MRLPQVLRELQVNSSVMFEMKAGSRSYHMTLTHDLFARKCEAVFREVRQLIEEMAVKYGESEMPLALEVTHRVGPLPGFREEINKIANIDFYEKKDVYAISNTISSFLHMVKYRMERGILNRDFANYVRNVGVVDNKVIEVDVGSFYKKDIHDQASYKNEIIISTEPFRDFLKKEMKEYTYIFDQKLEEIL